ncbi:MAG: NAD-dependent epimerase/dehydratase family protein [Kiritimatiellae bacterium]|nr:NAD-dependent epimerase/dehydratase family protein [Kiritimatiellia bacterium]
MNLVTGGLGFIGNELVRQLKSTGQPVAILDNRNRVAPDIEDIADVPLYEADITDRAAVRAVMAEVKPHRVFHLAAIHFIPECNANPGRTLRVNVEGTQTILDEAGQAGVEHVLFASSGAVYADSPDPLTETSPVQPVDIYGWSKSMGEDLCRWHAASRGLPITVCRFFNNIGPRETNLHIVPEILFQLRTGRALKLGTLTTVRDYITTADTARALIRLAPMCPSPIRVVNIATGHGASVQDLVNLLSELLGDPIAIELDMARVRKADKQIQVADMALLRGLLDWAPSTGLRDALAALLRYEELAPHC